MRSPDPRGTLTLALALTIGCSSGDAERASADAIMPAGAPALDLAGKPQVLFQLFGDREEPRVVPLAVVVNGSIHAIGLTRGGWRQFDSLYLAAGTKYPIYRDAMEIGEVALTEERPVASLPGCRSLMPIAGGRVTLKAPSAEPNVEFIASSAPITRRGGPAATFPTEAEVARLGRAFGHTVGKRAGMEAAELDSLDFHARMIVTGATPEPTMLVSFVDPNAGDLGPGAGHTSHLFILADKPGADWEATYRHAVSGDAKTVEFRRLVDHLDANGDGIDELILEAWRYASPTDLVVLGFRGGQWREVLRVKQNWCLDAPRTTR